MNWDQIRQIPDFIKLSHSLFALPFALSAMVVAARGWPGWKICLLIVACMVTARTAAMVFNRIVDRKYDAKNPRTVQRHLPAEKIPLSLAWFLFIVTSAAFVVCTFWINPLVFRLSPVALMVICLYSYTKRFTSLSHFVLGAALGLAPVGAWLAVTGSWSGFPILLGITVLTWVAGFDLIYATQDTDFDVREKLHSIPAKIGIAGALKLSFFLHLLTIAGCILIGTLYRFHIPYFMGISFIIALLLWEHTLVKKRDLQKINMAFFRANALISLVFFASVITDVCLE